MFDNITDMPTVSLGFIGCGSLGDCEESKAENSTSREIQYKPYFRFQNEEYPLNAEIGQIMLYLGLVRGKSIAIFLSPLEVHL